MARWRETEAQAAEACGQWRTATTVLLMRLRLSFSLLVDGRAKCVPDPG